MLTSEKCPLLGSDCDRQIKRLALRLCGCIDVVKTNASVKIAEHISDCPTIDPRDAVLAAAYYLGIPGDNALYLPYSTDDEIRLATTDEIVRLEKAAEEAVQSGFTVKAIVVCEDGYAVLARSFI